MSKEMGGGLNASQIIHRYFFLSLEISLKSLAKEILSPFLSCLSKR